MTRALVGAARSINNVMGNNMDLKQTYNLIAEDWNKDHNDDDWGREATDKFISFLKPGDLVLDVGCAGGLKSKYLADNGLRTIGIDLSDKMIEIAKRQMPAGIFMTLGLEGVDKLEYLFDGIFMQAVLLHIAKKDVETSLRKLVAKLTVGGCLFVAVKQKGAEGIEEEVKTEDDYGYPYERFFSYYEVKEVEEYFRKCGLEIVFSKVKVMSGTNWIQVIGRKILTSSSN